MYHAGMDPMFSVLATRSCVSYARQVVASILSSSNYQLENHTIDYTNSLTVTTFADGEMEVTLNESVRGRVVFLFTTCARNESGLSVEECKIELYHTVDVLKRSQAAKIHVFEPYISCSRSDRTTRRNSVGFWIHYKTLISLGCDHVITYQLHSDKSKTVFDPCLCSIDDVPAISLLQRYLCETDVKTCEYLRTHIRDNWAFCSVDAGGEKLASKFARSFETQLIVAHKQRSATRPDTIDNFTIFTSGDLDGRTIWIVDDMIDTAGSIYGLVRELRKRAKRAINVMIIHPVLSGPAISRITELKDEGSLGRLVVCDTVFCETPAQRLPFMEVIKSGDFSARIITTIVQNQQMSDIIDRFSPDAFLTTRACALTDKPIDITRA